MIKFLALAFVIFPLCASASDMKGDYTIVGHGGQSCGSFLSAHKPNDMKLPYLGWLSGYLTAYNVYQEDKRGDILYSTDLQGAYQWIVQYCSKHPLDDFSKATQALILDLKKRQ
jgi:hypothetical protein